MLRRLSQILIIIAIIGGFAWAFWPRAISVEAEVIGTRDIKVTVAEEGKARIREIYTVSAPVSGQTLRIERHAGDTIAKGDTLFSLQPAASGLLDLRLRRVAEATSASARAGVELATAEVKRAETQLTYMKAELARAKTLASQNALSVSALDKAQLAVDTSSENLESAKATLDVRARELDRANAALIEAVVPTDSCCAEIKAPVSGRILRVLAENAQVVQAGTPVIQIGDPAEIEAVADVLSQDAVAIRLGAEAWIENWGGPPLPATVRRIEPSAISKISALGIEEQRVPVILDIVDKDRARNLGDGFRVIVRITVWNGQKVLAVPIAALFRRGESWAVFTVVNDRVKLNEITIGQRSDDYAEVYSGLDAGSSVILHPSDQLVEGAAVVTMNTSN